MRDSQETHQLIHQGMVSAGIDTNLVYQRLAQAGFMLSWDGRFNHEIHVAFWRVLEDVTGDPAIGLHLCRHLPTYRGRVFEYLFLSSANYKEGLHAAFKYQRLVSDAFQVHLLLDGAEPCILVEGASGEQPELRHSEICTAFSFLKAMEVVTDGRFRPNRIRLGCKPHAPLKEYEDTFGCTVEFINTPTEICFAPELLKCRSPHSDPEMLKLHTKYADNQVAKLARQDLLDDVQDYLRREIDAEDNHNRGVGLTLTDVAEAFGVSERNLRFVFTEAGTSFRELYKEVRLTYACRALKRTDNPVEQVALHAGFSEPSTFSRAFKQWSGLTPNQFREAKRVQAS